MIDCGRGGQHCYHLYASVTLDIDVALYPSIFLLWNLKLVCIRTFLGSDVRSLLSPVVSSALTSISSIFFLISDGQHRQFLAA